jgi:glucosamine kinase
MAEGLTEGPALFMGIDGGGSRCRARLRDAGGALLASAQAGGANVYLDFDGALATIRGCVADTLQQAGLPPAAQRRVHLGLGLAGVSSPAIAGLVETALDGFAAVRVSNDAVTACLGAHGGRDGGLIIAGTGSAGLALVEGREVFVGGRGFVLGDDGSGARIGLDAWRRALRAHDGLEEHTPFTRELMAQFGDDPAAVIRWGLTARSSHYGAYAPAVFTAAATGDPTALHIVRTAAEALSELAAALRRHGAERIALVGGGAEAIRPYLPATMTEHLTVPLFDALDGAILLVGGPPGPFGLEPGAERT